MIVCGLKAKAWMWNKDTLQFSRLPNLPFSRNMPMTGVVQFLDGSPREVVRCRRLGNKKMGYS